jgi:hypothetical protein
VQFFERELDDGEVFGKGKKGKRQKRLIERELVCGRTDHQPFSRTPQFVGYRVFNHVQSMSIVLHIYTKITCINEMCQPRFNAGNWWAY